MPDRIPEQPLPPNRDARLLTAYDRRFVLTHMEPAQAMRRLLDHADAMDALLCTVTCATCKDGSE